MAVFEKAKNLVDSALEGFNSTLFAYGQTGSGKTYTLQGTNEVDGLAQLSFKYLHEELKKKQDNFKVKLKCSVIQIYYSEIVDLLMENGAQPRQIDII